MTTKTKAKPAADTAPSTAPRLMTGAQIVVEALREQGVSLMFGYPGGAVLPIYDALYGQDAIRHIRVHTLVNGLGPDVADTGLERGFRKPLHRGQGRRQCCGKEHLVHDDQGLAQAG
jgi:hypothetical protein